jgi:hypothetical protein
MKMRKTSIYIIAIIFLLVTNIATVITIRKILRTREETKPVLELPQESRLRYFRGSIGLIDDQIDEFARYNRIYNERAGEINRSLISLRRQMVIEISSEKPDQKEIESILRDFGAGHIELKKATIEYYNNLKSLCNEEQQKNLELFFRDMLDPQGAVYLRRQGPNGQGRGLRQGMRGREAWRQGNRN